MISPKGALMEDCAEPRRMPFLKVQKPHNAHLSTDDDDVNLQHSCRCTELIKSSSASTMNALSAPPHRGSSLVSYKLVSISLSLLMRKVRGRGRSVVVVSGNRVHLSLVRRIDGVVVVVAVVVLGEDVEGRVEAEE
eukprot:4795045-Pleurochrysis_carterae.AAC.1